MKKLVMILLLSLVSIGAVSAQDDSVRTVTVLGLAGEQIPADNIIWSLNIFVRESKQDKLQKRTDSLLQLIKTKINTRIQYKTKNRITTNKVSYYEYSQRLILTQKEIARYDDFYKAFTSIPGINVEQRYTASQAVTHLRELRLAALENAQQKAEDYARVIGGTLGDVISISEFNPAQHYAGTNELAYLNDSGVRQPEKISLSARIYVIFELK